MIAIDSSSVVKYVVREENWEDVEKELGEGCVSLELSVKETGNALWRRTRGGELGEEKAKKYFAEFIRSRPFVLAEQDELYELALEVSISQRLPLYDSLFLALAKQKGIRLVTSDKGQADAARKLAVDVQFIP